MLKLFHFNVFRATMHNHQLCIQAAYQTIGFPPLQVYPSSRGVNANSLSLPVIESFYDGYLLH